MIMRDERQEVIHSSFTLNPFFHVQNGQLDKKYFCVFKMLRCLPQFLWLSLVCCIEGCGLFFFTLDCVTFVWIYIIIQLLSKKNIVIQSFFNYFNLLRCIFNFLLVIEVVSVKKNQRNQMDWRDVLLYSSRKMQHAYSDSSSATWLIASSGSSIKIEKQQ